ncbi:MAG: hypothetical protein ABIJ09_16860 [Pseudomonadota bacterium]
MKKWTPKLQGRLDWARLRLSPEEGFLLSRIDGSTSVLELTQLTGLSGDRVEQILGDLIAQGAVQPGLDRAEPLASPAASPAPAPIDLGAPAAVADQVAVDDAPVAPGKASGPGEVDAARAGDEDDAAREGAELAAAGQDGACDTDAVASDGAHADLDDGSAGLGVDDDEALEPDDEDEPPTDLEEQAAQAERDRNYRKLFETRFHPLPADQREAQAREVGGAELLALCFDSEPAVVRAVLANEESGPPHARLIAAHHGNPVGLDAVAADTRYLRDRQVQRFLLRNGQTSERVLARILHPKPLMAAYRVATSRELSERGKNCAHQALRRCFARSSAEERVALIYTSEGRVLPLLHGTSLDGKTTALLCGHSYTSTLLIQNLLRWSATPPPLLARLFLQPTVRRNPQLRQLVLRHSNCPAQLKREK